MLARMSAAFSPRPRRSPTWRVPAGGGAPRGGASPRAPPAADGAGAEVAVAAVAAEASGDDVAEARQAGERAGVGPECDAEARHLRQAARQQRRLGVVAEAEAVADAGRDPDHVLQRPG